MLELEPFYHTNQFQPTWLKVHLLLKTLAQSLAIALLTPAM
jgi:hypothetical protein